MVKTPEEYFADQCLAVPQAADATLSAAEQAFVQKYLGSDALQNMPVQEPEQVLAGAAGAASVAPELDDAHPSAHKASSASAPSLRTRLAALEQVQMVSFYIREQIFLLPVSVIVEVLRHMPLTRLPMAPPFIAGVVNLRGKVTPLLHLDALLTTDQTMRYSEKSFIIVCGNRGNLLDFIIVVTNCLRLRFQILNNSRYCFVNTSFQVHRVCARCYVFKTFSYDCLC